MPMTTNSNELSEIMHRLQELVSPLRADAEERNSTFIHEAAEGIEAAATELESAMQHLESFEAGEDDEPLNDVEEDDEHLEEDRRLAAGEG
tara:strand:+ start:170413 stop:170685 length:273 start_codon:yes stop_codon:yes gene_type:complete